MSKTINDLREHLFAALEALNDKTAPMDIARAKAIADVAQVVINSAKVEVEHMKLANTTTGTGFIPEAEPAKLAAPPNGKHRLADLPARTHKLVG